MRGGALPPALMLAALALALGFAPRRMIGWGLAAAALAALAAAMLGATWAPFDPAWADAVFLGLWASLALTAASVHLPGGPAPPVAVALSVNAGFWSGAAVAVAGVALDLLWAAPALLLCLPAAWLAAGRGRVAVKVLAGWLIAVALLAAALPMVATAGYEADHME